MKRVSAKIIMLYGWRRALVALFSGALLAFAQAPFDFFFVGFLSFPVLIWLLDGVAWKRRKGFFLITQPAFAVGWFFGFGYFLSGLWWISAALLVDAEQFAWAVPLAVTVVPAGLAIFYGLATLVARLLWSEGIGRIFALAVSFGIFEWLRGTILTGFPWNPVGFAAMPNPLLMQTVELVGSASMNILAVLVFSIPSLMNNQRHRSMGLALGMLLIIGHAGYGYWQLRQPIDGERITTINARLVQPSIDQSEKWDASVRDRIFSTLLDLSKQPVENGVNPDLIVWPETSVPFLLTDRPDALVQIADLLTNDQMLVAGIVREESDPSVQGGAVYYNSMVAIDQAGIIADALDKVHLVPFGEYMPFEEQLAQWGITKIVPMPASFRAGIPSTLTILDGIVASGFICYEIIFASEVAHAANNSGVIINITNDAWFGATPGPYQHFRQAQVRAVETGLSVIRAANTGISGVIDPKGRIVGALSLNSKGYIDVEVTVRPDHQTPSSRHLQIFGYVSMVLILLSCLLRVTQRSRNFS